MGSEASISSRSEEKADGDHSEIASSDHVRWRLASSVLGGGGRQGSMLFSVAAAAGGLFGVFTAWVVLEAW